MELRDYLRVMRRRWLLIVLTVLSTVAVAAIVTMQMTPIYSSTARMFVSTSPTDASQAYQGGMFAEQRVQSYADLITGERVVGRVIKELELSETPAELSEDLTASVAPETVILEVSASDPDPERAQLIAATTAEQFIQVVRNLETPEGQRRPLVKASVIDGADVPDSPVSPQPLRNIGLAAVLGLLLGLGLAVLRELLDTTIKSTDDVNEITESSMLGAITYDGQAPKRPLITQLDSHAPRVESFRVLRTNLQFIDVDQDSKAIVVTSSVPEEGKTTTACNLAITLAQAGHRTVLVEGDLRRPKMAEHLRLETAVGLTTALIGRIDLVDALQPWGVDGLQVLTSGTIPPNPAELLQSQALSDALGQLRKHFDMIVVDAPPLLPVTDGALLASRADGAILVVRHGETTRDQVRESVDRLESVDARLLGTVLNMVPTRGPSGYGYGYGYGYAPEAGRRKPSGRRRSDPVSQR